MLKITPTPIVVDTLDGVIARLEQIIEQSRKSGSRMGYFAALYHKVTVKVKEGVASGEFGDGKNIIKLDIQFANRYFAALDQWQQGKPVSQSWQVAFDATAKRPYLILQHLLLGMNAHINLDLGIATYEASDGKLDDFKKDYNHINLILSSLTYGVINKLNTLSPLLSLLGFSGTKSNSMLVQFSMGNARDGSWCFAEALAEHEDSGYETFIAERDNEIFELGESLITSRGFLKFGICLIHLFEKKNVRKVIGVLAEYQKPYKKTLAGFKK
jgi:hypothetical protein